MSGTPPAPGEAGELREVNAGLRAANAWLRELPEARDAQIEALTGQLEELRAQVADLAAQVRQDRENSSRPPSSDGLGEPPACRKCGTGLACARETGAGRRQVTEIPPVKAEVTGRSSE